MVLSRARQKLPAALAQGVAQHWVLPLSPHTRKPAASLESRDRKQLDRSLRLKVSELQDFYLLF